MILSNNKKHKLFNMISTIKMNPETLQERLVMSFSPIVGVKYELINVNIENEVNEWEPEEGE
jgi:hypothetical protein